MFFINFSQILVDSKEQINYLSINDFALCAANDEDTFEKLVKKYKPFICARIKSVTGLQFVTEHDDVFSIAMIAFYEAVKTYNVERGGFIGYASFVIRNRLIDNMRKNGQDLELVSLDSEEERDEINNDESPVIKQISQFEYIVSCEQEAIKDEIDELSRQLGQWNITFENMEEDSPKHKRVRDDVWEIIKHIVNNEEICKTIINKKYLPTKEICKNTIISVKKIEKFRRYIVACVIIALGDYPILHSYLRI